MASGKNALTPRQREVLRLIAERKTNGEIAAQLGISLDTAKSHVRDIIGELGVDAREEAAEWWRQQRGLRARFALGDLGARVSRMPALLRWGIGGAGVAGVAVGVVAMWMALAPGDEETPLDDARVVLRRPVDPAADRVHAELLYRDAGSEEWKTLGDPGTWLDLVWSPDGAVLAALRHDISGDALSGTVHTFNVESGQHGSADAGTVTVLRWGPDGEHFYAFGEDAVRRFDRQGNATGSAAGPPRPQSALQVIGEWSPDGRYFWNGPVGRGWVFDSHELEVIEFELPPGLPAQPDSDRRDAADIGLWAGRWTSEDALDLVYMEFAEDASYHRFVVQIGNGEPTWEKQPGSDHQDTRIAWHGAPDYDWLQNDLPFENAEAGCVARCPTPDSPGRPFLIFHADPGAQDVRTPVVVGRPDRDRTPGRSGTATLPAGATLSLAVRDEGEIKTMELPVDLVHGYQGSGRLRDFNGIHVAVTLLED